MNDLDPSNLQKITIKPSRFKWGFVIIIILLFSAFFFWVAHSTPSVDKALNASIAAFILIAIALFGCRKFIPGVGVLKIHKHGLEAIGCLSYVNYRWEDIDEFSTMYIRWNKFVACNLSGKHKNSLSF